MLVFSETNGPVEPYEKLGDAAAPVSTTPAPFTEWPLHERCTPVCGLAVPLQPLPKSEDLRSDVCAAFVPALVCLIAGPAAAPAASRTESKTRIGKTVP